MLSKVCSMYFKLCDIICILIRMHRLVERNILNTTQLKEMCKYMLALSILMITKQIDYYNLMSINSTYLFAQAVYN